MTAALGLVDVANLMPVHPAVPLLVVLGLAAICFALGTFKGSWRVWLAGYTLTVLALVLAFAGMRAQRRAAAAVPPPASSAPPLPAVHP